MIAEAARPDRRQGTGTGTGTEQGVRKNASRSSAPCYARPRSIPFQYISGSAYAFIAYML